MPAPKPATPFEREATTREHGALPDEAAHDARLATLAEAKRSGVRPALADDELERFERRERRDTLPAPPDEP